MLGWTLLIIAFLFVLTLRAIAGNKLPRPNVPVWMPIVLIIVLLLGGYLTVDSSWKLKNALSRKDWPVAKGRVIKSEPIVQGIIRPMVIYAFEVNGRAYVDTSDLQVPGFGNKNKQYEVAHTLVEEYPTGKEVLVHYDSTDFSNSVLIVTPPWNVFGKVSLGVILFSVGLFFLVLPRPR